jgi:hypothetical protein
MTEKEKFGLALVILSTNSSKWESALYFTIYLVLFAIGLFLFFSESNGTPTAKCTRCSKELQPDNEMYCGTCWRA